MTGKLSVLVGFGAGYVLGARSGRERYDEIAAKAQQLWRHPRTQETVEQAQQVVKEKVGSTSSEDGTTTSTSGSHVSSGR
jgi:hypothetical protein